MPPRFILPGLTAAVVGLVVGLGTYTFLYGQAYAYLLDDPSACVNCHIMRDPYDLWLVASHRTVPCNGCHVPASPLGKYPAKLRSGWRHAYAFTWEDVQVLRVQPSTREVLQANCERCHAAVVAEIMPRGSARVKFCFDCHRGVAHGSGEAPAGPPPERKFPSP